jgi:Flp pilus assembly pilin Flp
MLFSPHHLSAEHNQGGKRVRVWAKEHMRKFRQWMIDAKAGNVFIENGIWIIIVVLAMILPIEALRNALVGAFNQITSNLNSIP